MAKSKPAASQSAFQAKSAILPTDTGIDGDHFSENALMIVTLKGKL